MKNQRDRLHQYQRRITTITDRETAIAKECLTKGDKPKALLALRRKKFQQSLLAKTDAQLETLEQLTSNIEFALVQKDVVFGLQQGTKVLKQIHTEMGGIDKVEKLMGESADAVAYQKEISEMLAGQMSNQDEDEVEDELAALEGEVSNIRKAEESVDMPMVPAGDVGINAQNQKTRAEERKAALREQEPMLA